MKVLIFLFFIFISYIKTEEEEICALTHTSYFVVS